MGTIILCLDVGTKRVGLATSDPSQSLATPRPAIPRQGSVKAVAEIALNEEVILILVGMPYLPSGKKGSQARLTDEFISSLEQSTKTDIATIDERFTTKEAMKKLMTLPGGRKKIRRNDGTLDSASAAVMLQSYLDNNEIKI